MTGFEPVTCCLRISVMGVLRYIVNLRGRSKTHRNLFNCVPPDVPPPKTVHRGTAAQTNRARREEFDAAAKVFGYLQALLERHKSPAPEFVDDERAEAVDEARKRLGEPEFELAAQAGRDYLDADVKKVKLELLRFSL